MIQERKNIRKRMKQVEKKQNKGRKQYRRKERKKERKKAKGKKERKMNKEGCLNKGNILFIDLERWRVKIWKVEEDLTRPGYNRGNCYQYNK